MSATRYDWAKIEQEYVTGKMALRTLAEKYHISEGTIYKHAKEGHFDEKRRKYAEKVAKKAVSRASTRDARLISKIMTGAERTTRELVKAITEKTLYGYIVEDTGSEDPETGEKIPGGLRVQLTDKADTKAIVNLSTAIRNLAMATRVMYPDGDGEGKEESQGVIVLAERAEDEDER